MKLIAVRMAALVILASIIPPGIEAQGQNAITSRAIDESWRFFPCASGVIGKLGRARVEKDQTKSLTTVVGRKKSRRMERRL